MIRLAWRCAAVIVVAAIAGCARVPKNVVVLLDEDGKVGQVVVRPNDGGEVVLNQANQASSLDDAAATTVERSDIDAIFGGALQAEPLAPAKFILYFIHDSDDLTKESEALLPKVLDAIGARPAPNVAVVGHTDRSGEADYNAQLALGRAQVIARKVVGIGVPQNLIEVTSHGENNPLIETADGVAKRENRRVEIFVR